MKFLMTLLVLIVSTSQIAHADSLLLECATGGFGLADLKVVLNSDGSASLLVQKSENEDEVAEKYLVASGVKDLKAKTSATLIAQKVTGKDEGNTRTEAALLRVLDGQKRAYLAIDGNVHTLSCF